MNFRAFRRIAVIVLGALALTHCARNPVGPGGGAAQKVGRQEGDPGAQANRELLKAYAVLDAPVLQGYVNEVGQRLAQQTGRGDLTWRFTVVDSPEVDAFSLPGGYVYVTRGLLAYLNTEAELASVLCHEMGHVAARHGLRQPAPPAAAALGSVLSPDGGGESDVLRMLAQARAGGYGGDAEREADRLGAGYLVRAHYAPRALADARAALRNQALAAAAQAQGGGGPVQAYHAAFLPVAGEAVAAAERAGTPDGTPPRSGRDDYLHKTEGLVFGDSPAQGVIRNNALLHDKLGLAMQFPPGWQVKNWPEQAFALSPQGDAVVELEQGPQSDDPMATLRQGVRLDAGARYDSGRLGGYAAAFAAGHQQGRPVVVAVVVMGRVQYLIAGMTRDADAYERERSALRAAINSFHAITPAERLAARPHTLRLVAARPGVTMTAMAQQSPLGADAETQLRLINALYPAGEPVPGQLLKIVE